MCAQPLTFNPASPAPQARALELKLAFWNAMMKVINISIVFCVPPLTAFVIFTTYEFQDARLTSTVAFTTLSLFNILRFPLVVLPKALRACSEAYSSVTRLEEYLLEETHVAKKVAPSATAAAHGVHIVSGVSARTSEECRREQTTSLLTT